MQPSFSPSNKPRELRKNPRNANLRASHKEIDTNQQNIPKINLAFDIKEVKQPNSARNQHNPRTSVRKSSNPRFKNHAPQTARYVPLPTNPIVKKGPIRPLEAKEIYKHMLTSYEMREIDDFDDIYFIGNYSKKIKPHQSSSMNHGYDDSSHHLKVNIGDHLAYRFEIKSVFGKGAFGQVLCCYDHKEKKQVAIKVVINTQQMQEQGRVEVAILQHLNSLDYEHKSYIVRSMDSFLFRNHVCATFEVLGKNLYEYSKSIGFAPFTQRQIKAVAKKILTAIAFCHKNGIVHCDLKPENVVFLPGSSMNCRLIDFGSGCYKGRQKFEYIQSRFYRAPEVVLGYPYGPPMDIWSFACIVVEMLSGRPLFPADDENELISMMMEVLGIPPYDFLVLSKRAGYYFNSDGKPINTRSRKRRIPGQLSLRAATRINDSELLDLLKKCLEWDPNKRITASEALNHKWFNIKTNYKAKSARNPPLITGRRFR